MFNYLIYAVVIVMFVRILIMQKRNNKNRKLIECVNTIEDRDAFFEKTENLINTIGDEEFVNKLRVIKLWGMAYHKEYMQFDETMKSIQVEKLMSQKNGEVSIEMDEDSFFYLYVAIPELLEVGGMPNYRRSLRDFMSVWNDTLSNKMVAVMAKEIDRYYEKSDDLGLAFYEKVLSGDYGEYKYAKSLIGLYKGIINAQAARIYTDQGNSEKLAECQELLENFARTGVGSRWLKGLNLEVIQEDTEENDVETFDMGETSEEDEDQE